MQFTEPNVNSGNPVFGWVRINKTIINTPPVGTTGNTGITVVDWAYEDSGAGIIAGATGTATPEPSSLALLASGVVGLAVRRNKVRARCA